MKAYMIFILGVVLSPSFLLADDLIINKESTAKAYRAHLMTFAWPAENTVEQVKYQTLLSLKATPQFSSTNNNSTSSSTQSTGANIEKINNPFDEYQKKLKRGVTVLTNDAWTLIFENQGSKLHKTLHSQPNDQGYAELVGSIQIKLGRYLESNIELNHFLFSYTTLHSETEHHLTSDTITNVEQSQPANIQNTLQPYSQLIINQNNKTASKKLNYLDHPIIGTLLYFEPMNLEEATQQQALENLMSNIEQIGNTNTQ